MQVLQVQLDVRPDPAEVARARKWARSRLAGCGIRADEPIAETVILLVSELVTNAVVHTGRPAVLRLSLPGAAAHGAIVRLEVADRSTRAPVPRCPDGDATGGRGLALVDGLADRWGWNAEGAGKRIWCELDRCARPSAADACTVCTAGTAGAAATDARTGGAATAKSVTAKSVTAGSVKAGSVACGGGALAYDGCAYEAV